MNLVTKELQQLN